MTFDTLYFVSQISDVVFRSMTIMLVTVSLYSLVTTIPRLIVVGMNNINKQRISFNEYWFYMWGARTIAPWNYCGNFFMYILSGKEFREELALMFCCRERPSGAFLYLTLRYVTLHYITLHHRQRSRAALY